MQKSLKTKQKIIDKYKKKEKNLTNTSNNFGNNLNINHNRTFSGQFKKNSEMFPKYTCNNDIEREMKLKRILDNINFEKEITKFCQNLNYEQVC